MKKIAVLLLFDDNRKMNQNSDSPQLDLEFLFTLSVRIPEQLPIEIEVVDHVLAGLDPRNDLILIDPKVQVKHFLFRNKNRILTVQYLGRDGDTFLNGLPLEKGKLYILEKDDRLKVGKIEIGVGDQKIITKSSKTIALARRDLSPVTVPANRLNDFLAESEDLKENDETLIENPPETVVHKKTKKNTRGPQSDFKTVALIPYKFYGFLVDIALTYLLLALLLPSMGIMGQVQDFLYPISNYLSQYLLGHYPEFPTSKALSLLEFFISFHCLMVVCALFLGSTPGAFLVGVHQKQNRNFLAIRFKAYIYALLNIVALPLLIFDIPLYKGKNIKELLSFSAHELNSSLFFRISRRAITPLLIAASFLSPFFLKPPYTANLTKEKLTLPKYIDTHTAHISSYSRDLGFSLKTDLNRGFALLPYFTKNKLGLVLYEFNSKKSLMMKETARTSIEQTFFKLRYANPLASLIYSKNEIENEFLKNQAVRSLDLSLTGLLPGLSDFGPFVASGFLFKEEFLKNFSEIDNFLINSFDAKNPALKISTSAKSNKMMNEEKVFLFSRKGILQFSLIVPKQTKLLEHFVNSVLAPLRYDQSSQNGPKDPEILEVLEAFERSKYQTLLTYYINEAKKAQALKNPEWQAYLRNNLVQTKQALQEDDARTGLTKSIEKSFDDIINSL